MSNTASTFVKDLEKLMGLWNIARAAWLIEFGTDEGFASWFKDRVTRDEAWEKGLAERIARYRVKLLGEAAGAARAARAAARAEAAEDSPLDLIAIAHKAVEGE